MKPTEQTTLLMISNHVNPARLRGEATIQVRVGNIQKELGWTNRTPSVFSTLTSKEFQKEAGVELIEKRGGPPSGGPSTSWIFVYRLLGQSGIDGPVKKFPKNGGGLMALYGICAEMYREVGGGEAFIRSQRENFGSIADVPEAVEVQSR